MWQTILLSVFIATISGVVYLSWALARMEIMRKILPSKAFLRILCGLGILLFSGAVSALCLGMMNTIICFLHLLVIWLTTQAVFALYKAISRRSYRQDVVGLTAIILTLLVLVQGWHNAHHVSLTRYDLETEKDLGVDSLNIVAFSDSHLGATFHHEQFKEYIQEINSLCPDLVVIVGDYVDDSSTMEDLVECSKALKDLKTRFGVYYVYGNHDRRYYQREGGYTSEDLKRCLEENGVHILEDEVVSLTGNIYLAGRNNGSRDSYGRLGAQDLMRSVPDQKRAYTIVLDHQPNDSQAEAASGMDLVLSGHTHGGQFFGLGAIGVMMGANDFYYGHREINGTDFIVSSGIGDWELDFKTGCISEYVQILVRQKRD